MKPIILFIALAVFTANPISASVVAPGTVEQKAKPTPEERAKAEVKRMTELLAISAEQAARIMPLAVAKYKAQIAVRKKHKGDEQAIKSETKKVQATYASELKQILSSEQYAKLRAQRAKTGGKRKKTK